MFERTKINEKEARVGPFKKEKTSRQRQIGNGRNENCLNWHRNHFGLNVFVQVLWQLKSFGYLVRCHHSVAIVSGQNSLLNEATKFQPVR